MKPRGEYIIHHRGKEVISMCCEPEDQKLFKMAVGCCPECSEPSFRRYKTKKEKLAELEEYKNQLENELIGVNERLKELSGK